MIEDFLLSVMKPARYTGGEWNIPERDFAAAGVRVLLAFPDLYELGMSNIGIRLLYSILNSRDDVSCERIFSYADDMDAAMSERGIEAFSLETRTPMRAFDLVGFSLGSELAYTNVLRLLELGRVPLLAADRANADPLIIGGGPAVMNPEPIADFFDLFVIGEAEEALPEIVEHYKQKKDALRSGALSRAEVLRGLAGIEGVYVPSLYAAAYGAGGRFAGLSRLDDSVPALVRKRYVKDFANAPFPTDWLVPFIQLVHDRVSLEIMRGCPNRCRFCQAKPQYAPLRIRTPETLFRLARESYRRTGYEEISLCGLSVSDYPNLGEVIKTFITAFKPHGVGISLPSVKARAMLGDFFTLIAGIKKSGLTFAPEAGTERLRRSLAKDFDEAVFFEALSKAYAAGHQHVKLYYMLGLPGETSQDLDGIADFSMRVSDARRAVAGAPAQVNISVNTFIPKPHTPFQWAGMDTPEQTAQKQAYVRRALRSKRLRISFHDSAMSFLEGVFSRGDRRLGAVILAAYRAGARFDAWQDHFSFGRWEEAFRCAGIDPYTYVRERAPEEALPWDLLDVCGDKQALLEEYRRSRQD